MLAQEKSHQRRVSSVRLVMGPKVMKEITRDVLAGMNRLGGSCGCCVREHGVIRRKGC